MSVADPSTPSTLARTALGAVADRLAGVARASAFWTAALLPLSYLPLLVTGVVADRPLAFAALLLVNAVALLAGHDHRR